MSQTERILDLLRAADRPLSPYTIAEKLGINDNSVRGRLSDLARKGMIERVYRGYYQIISTQGVGASIKPPKIQNIKAIVHPSPRLTKPILEKGRADGLVYYKKREYHHIFEFQGPPEGNDGMVRLDLTFGLTRNKITWDMKAPLGLDYYGLMISYEYVKKIINLVGVSILESDYIDFSKPRCFMMVNYEFLDDIIGIKLEGVNCITFRTFEGHFEKIYSKTYGVRREVRSNQPRPISEILALYQGGLPNYMVAQASYDIARTVEKQTEAIKHVNRNLVNLVSQNNVIAKAQLKVLDFLAEKENRS